MRSFRFAKSLLFIFIHFATFALAIGTISKYFGDLKEEPLTLNVSPLKALMYGAISCPCGSCIDVDLSKYLTFYYST